MEKMSLELEFKDCYTKKEVKENGGCIMVWRGNDSGYDSVHSNAWENMAKIMISKYKHKVPYIKSIKEGTYFNGVRWLEVHENHGVRRFNYIEC